MATKKCVVFGSTGQDGSLLCKSLIKQGHVVIGTSREKIKQCANHIQIGIDQACEIYKLDYSNSKEVMQFIDEHNPDEIYNMSAQSSVSLSFKQPQETFKSIVEFTIILLEACKNLQFNGRILFAGSGEMYGHSESPINIKSPRKPISPYGIAKNTSYELVKMYRNLYNLQCMTAIFFNHESELRHSSFVISKIVQAVKKSSQSEKYKITMGNIEIYRDWGWAEEFIEALQLICRANKIKDYIVCTGEKMQLKQLIKLAFEYNQLNWKNHISIDNSLLRPSDILISYGDPRELNNELGWRSKLKGNELIKKLIEHSKQ